MRLAQGDGTWMIGLAGVLLPGLRRIAASAQPINTPAAALVEADVLERFRSTLRQPQPHGTRFALSVLHLAYSQQPPTPKPIGRGHNHHAAT